MFHGRVRHDMLHEGYGTIAGDPTRQAAVRIAVSRLAHALGGCGTTCCTKDTGPSRATQLVRPPSVSPSVGLRMRSIVPSARAALGVLGHARSDARTLNSFGHLAMPLFSFFHLSALLQ